MSTRRAPRMFKFVWTNDGGAWRCIYVMSGPGGGCTPDYWLQCLAHELIHAAGFLRGALPAPGPRFHRFASTIPEEQLARDGAVVLMQTHGLVPDLGCLQELGELPVAYATELQMRLDLVRGVGDQGP